jgi:hypothetical protein
MNKIKNWRVAVTIVAVAMLCAYILYDGLEQPEPAARAFTMLLGFFCGFVPAALAVLMPRFINVVLALFIYFLALVLFLAGGLAFGSSHLWVYGVFGASTDVITFQVAIWHFFPAFLLSTVAVEGFRYYRSVKRAASAGLPDDEEEDE